jgi:hypothetical protein
MASRLERWQHSLPRPDLAPDAAGREVDAETRRALESLGYLPDEPTDEAEPRP